MRLTIGVDLAQARDRTALAAIDSWRAEPVQSGRRSRRLLHHDLIDLERLRPGIPYPQQAELITAFADRFATEARPTIFVDATGVGRPVLDLLRRDCPYRVRGITISPGATVTATGNDMSVPKADLIGALDVGLSGRRIHFAPELALARELDKELRAFSYEMSATGRPKYEGRGAHDDLVLALALAVWGAESGADAGAAFREFIREDTARRGRITEGIQ